MTSITLPLVSLAALKTFSQQLSKVLKPGDVLALEGSLGSGKTTLAQNLAQALGIQEVVTSPSFVLLNEYHSGRIPLLHADLYRLGPEGANRLQPDLTAAIEAGEALILIEWAHYAPYLAPDITLQITIQIPEGRQTQPQARILTLQSTRPSLTEAIQQFLSKQ